MSPPSRGCGLKFRVSRFHFRPHQVTPFAGVWIEIPLSSFIADTSFVTPFAGVWIEITQHTGLKAL